MVGTSDVTHLKLQAGAIMKKVYVIYLILLCALSLSAAQLFGPGAASAFNSASSGAIAEPSRIVAPFAPMTFTVNSNADPGNGTCDSGECTLREAISAANLNLGLDTIAFSIATGPQ